MTRKPSPLIPLTPPVYFVSDAHLGAAQGELGELQHRYLHELLDQVYQHGRTLVVAGDLFDFWYEWRHVVPKQHFPVLFHLKKLIDRQIAVHYLAGNHDFRVHGFLERTVGLATHADGLAAQIGDDAVYVFHGDGILASDHGYRLLKKVLRNPVVQRAFSWIHPDWAWSLARGTSITSRAVQRSEEEDDPDYLAFARAKFAEGFSGVVLGHTHRPYEHREARHTYINLGDWISQFTYGLHDGARLSLQQWPHSS
jgi:UDP-2,3-diacylglucosamine hydrolase